MGCGLNDECILEVCSKICGQTLGCLHIVMFETSLLCWQEIVGVLGGKGLVVRQWLHCGVVMVEMDFSVNRFGDYLISCWVDMFPSDCRSNNFFNISEVTRPGSVLSDKVLGSFHCRDRGRV